jgi:dipeptidase E
MKLYLTSLPPTNYGELLALLPKDKPLSAAVVANAWDVYAPERRKPIINALLAAFRSHDIKPTLIDLKQLTGDALRTALAKHALIWIMGGNTFLINELVHSSGLALFIKPLLEQGVVYGGESAGAVIAGTSLHGIELLDNPSDASKTIWNGLNLIDFGLIPHWGDEKDTALLEQCRIEMSKYTPVTTITNQQALVIDGAKIRTVQFS